jgi:hypothetical protein
MEWSDAASNSPTIDWSSSAADAAVSTSPAARAICDWAARRRIARQWFPLVCASAWWIPVAAAATFPWASLSSDRPGWGL